MDSSEPIKVTVHRSGVFELGAIVTRHGIDRHRVIGINEAGDLIHVECVVADDCYAIGFREWNIPGRYDRAEL